MDSKESFTPEQYAMGPKAVDPIVVPGEANGTSKTPAASTAEHT